jgi:hypothetical protein
MPQKSYFVYKYRLINNQYDYLPRMKFNTVPLEICGIQLTLNDIPIGWLGAPTPEEPLIFFSNSTRIPIRILYYQKIHINVFTEIRLTNPPKLTVQGGIYVYDNLPRLLYKYQLEYPDKKIISLRYENAIAQLDPYPETKKCKKDIPEKISITANASEFVMPHEDLIKKYIVSKSS